MLFRSRASVSTSVRPGPVPAARPRAPGWHGPPAPEPGLDVKTWVRFPGDPKLSRHRCLWMWRVCGVLCAVGARGRQCCLSADLNSLTTLEKQLTGRSCALKRACGNRQSLTVIAPLCSGGRGVRAEPGPVGWAPPRRRGAPGPGRGLQGGGWVWPGAPDAEGGWGVGTGAASCWLPCPGIQDGGLGGTPEPWFCSSPTDSRSWAPAGFQEAASELKTSVRVSGLLPAVSQPASPLSQTAGPGSGPWRSKGGLQGPCGENGGLSSLEARPRPRTCSPQEGPCLRESLEGTISGGCPGHSLQGGSTLPWG